jgi:signal transduction protein with GAF and PtsI domain
MVNPVVDEIEMLLHVASANEIMGLLEVIPIVTEVLEVGIPPHQLEAVFQSEVFPSQAPEAVMGILTELEVTALVVWQVLLAARITDTISVLSNALVEYVCAPAPILIPFSFH